MANREVLLESVPIRDGRVGCVGTVVQDQDVGRFAGDMSESGPEFVRRFSPRTTHVADYPADAGHLHVSDV